MNRGTISIYLFIPLKVMVYTSRLEKLKHDCAGAQSTHVCTPAMSSNHPGHVGVIYTVDGYIGLPHMYYVEPNRSLGQQTVLLQNSLQNWEFWLLQNYVGSGGCLFLDPLVGLLVKGFLQELCLANLYPVRLFVG